MDKSNEVRKCWYLTISRIVWKAVEIKDKVSFSPLFPSCLLLSPTISLKCMIKVKLKEIVPARRGEAGESAERRDKRSGFAVGVRKHATQT